MTLIQRQILLNNLLIKAFCPTGPGGGVDPTCSPGGGGGGYKTTDDFKNHLKEGPYGLTGTADADNVKVIGYRTGSVENAPRGIFFAGDKSGASAYSTLHEGDSIKKYKINIKKCLIAGHQGDVTMKFFKKPYGVTMDSLIRKYKDGPTASKKFDEKVKREAKKRGYDGLMYLKPAPPAKSEISVFDNKSIVEVED